MSDSATLSRRQIPQAPEGADERELFTLEDGYALFHEDGATTLHITIAPPATPPAQGKIGVQFDRAQRRLLELALAWARD